MTLEEKTQLQINDQHMALKKNTQNRSQTSIWH